MPVIDRRSHTERAKELRDIRLVNKNRTPKKNAPTEAEHAACPGHAAYLTVDSWSTPPRVRTAYVCTDPTGNGHHLYSYSSSNQSHRAADQRADERGTESRTANRRSQ